MNENELVEIIMTAFEGIQIILNSAAFLHQPHLVLGNLLRACKKISH